MHIFFSNRGVADAENYLDEYNLAEDEFLFKGLDTKTLKFKVGATRSQFVDAIRAYSKEVKDSPVSSKPLPVKDLNKTIGLLKEKFEKKVQTLTINGKSRFNKNKLSLKVMAIIELIKHKHKDIISYVANNINPTNPKIIEDWLNKVKITTPIKNPYHVLSEAMPEKIKEFLDEFIIKVEQPGVSQL